MQLRRHAQHSPEACKIQKADEQGNRHTGRAPRPQMQGGGGWGGRGVAGKKSLISHTLACLHVGLMNYHQSAHAVREGLPCRPSVLAVDSRL